MNHKRHEQKYLCSAGQIAHLLKILGAVLPRDEHQKAETYHISSLYFDTPDDHFLSESLNGIPRRSKYRFRSYNHDNNHLKFEKKSTFFHLKEKQFVWLNRQKMADLFSGKMQLSFPTDPLFAQFYSLQKISRIKPKVIIDYDRTAFVDKKLNIRITIDQNITASCDVNSFLGNNYFSKTILEKGQGILEVKFDHVLPAYIFQLLHLEDLEQISFSKYVIGRLNKKKFD